ncbi:RNA-guided endonuclease InsQ/TnpB family protein [Natrononativus amylolyticus]|uniref:RNA-guided endonuclease InsQ/TnpB family protein n=1 Tax=Natrononativus amylolyticus TaxID=2963434 RepID=UPI0020CCF42C|nr:transposase [Natrononativus amylolyticus]
MTRTDTFEVRPRSHRDELLLLELLDASAACNNQVNYDRRQTLFNAQDNADDRVPVSELKSTVKRAVSQEDYRQQYKHTLGSAAPQQLVQKNWESWKSYFELLSNYRNPDNAKVTDRPSPPGYWKLDGNRELHTVIRNDQYTLELGDRSRLEIPVGMDLKEKYGLGYYERLRLEVAGQLRWTGKQGRLELVYDRDTETFTAHRTVGNEDTPPRRRDTHSSTSLATSERGDEVVAAVDIGANNLAAVTTTQGDHRIYQGRPAFHTFHTHTERIAELQAILDDDEWSSKQIRRVYRKRGEQRNHLMDALIRDLGEWLVERGVSELTVGALGDMRAKHWSATVNEKTDLFWAHGRFRRRLNDVLELEYGITVTEKSEAGTSSECPECESRDVHRSGDLLQCYACGREGHADVAGSANFLRKHAEEGIEVRASGSMARPTAARENTTADGHSSSVPCLEWNDHEWTVKRSGQSTKEAPVTQSTTRMRGNVAPGGSDD